MNVFQRARKFLTDRLTPARQLQSLRKEIESAKVLSGRGLAVQMQSLGLQKNIRCAEFKVFSQFGDDGIIQYLIQHCQLAPAERTFIEFGVENYLESNTRFLLLHNNWRGLVMDADEANVAFIRNDDLYWRHDVTAVQSFIDADNINGLFARHGFRGPLGLLSIDVDGNDYWIWKAIDIVAPVIVVAEYNSVFGPDRAVTVPYDPRFRRGAAHFSHMYWGASVRAFCTVAEQRGYSFLGCNSAGNNAYFVRTDRLGPLRPVSVEEGYVCSQFRESRDPAGRLTFLSGMDRLRVMQDMPVYDVERDQRVALRDLLPPPPGPDQVARTQAA